MIQRLDDLSFWGWIRSRTGPYRGGPAMTLVVFSAPERCADCRVYHPHLHAWATGLRDAGYVDVESPRSANLDASFGKEGVPRTVVFAGDRLSASRVGPMTPEEIETFYVASCGPKIIVGRPLLVGGAPRVAEVRRRRW